MLPPFAPLKAAKACAHLPGLGKHLRCLGYKLLRRQTYIPYIWIEAARDARTE